MTEIDMASNEIIQQRKFDRKTWFKFGDDKVEFGYFDPSGEVTASAFYEAIDLENMTQVRVKAGRRYLWIALIFAFVAYLVLNASAERAFATVPLFVYVAFVLGIRFSNFLSVHITVLTVKAGSAIQRLRIINDTKHDEVVERLRAGWVARIRRLYATVRLDADQAQEAQRFRWMLDRKVIDETEYKRALTLIASASAPPSIESGKPN